MKPSQDTAKGRSAQKSDSTQHIHTKQLKPIKMHHKRLKVEEILSNFLLSFNYNFTSFYNLLPIFWTGDSKLTVIKQSICTAWCLNCFSLDWTIPVYQTAHSLKFPLRKEKSVFQLSMKCLSRCCPHVAIVCSITEVYPFCSTGNGFKITDTLSKCVTALTDVSTFIWFSC